MQSLVILPSTSPHPDYTWRLVIRRHDLSGTDYEGIVRLSTDQAYALVDNSNDIKFLYGDPRRKS